MQFLYICFGQIVRIYGILSKNGHSKVTNPQGFMKTFINDDFLLQSDFAKRLYHDHAKDLAILDYHNHLVPEELAQNRGFENFAQVWLEGDHYKWRAMRTLGVPEEFITGGASDQEKFVAWAKAVPYTVRNPLYHWTHLELLRYFGIDELLTGENALDIYATANNKLQQPTHDTLGLLAMQKVEVACTTDDPLNDLGHHKTVKEKKVPLRVLPSFRPDMAYTIEDSRSYLKYLQDLEDVTECPINSFDNLIAALSDRIDYFHDLGGRIADHGLDHFHYANVESYRVESIFSKVKDGDTISPNEISYFKTQVLICLGRLYHKKGWVQQFHLGALRSVSSRQLEQLGPHTGFDSMGDFLQAKALGDFLNALDRTNQLPKTIIYNINPKDNEMLATMTGNFNDGSIKGKVQFGAAWWFLDQKDGIEKQLNTLSNIGLMSCSVGMTSDSRSLLSFTRHEYFRRILCNLIGKDVANGELPSDEKWLGKIVQDICYNNAKEYFGF